MHKLSILETPTGRYMFVGSVPAQLAVDTDLPELIEVGARCGVGIASKIAANRGGYFRTRIFETREEAIDYAADFGYSVA